MSDIDWKVGAHTTFCGCISETLKVVVNYGMYVTQFFMGNPKGFNRSKIGLKDIEESKKILKRYPTAVFTHFPYVANLAGSVEHLAWSGDSKQDGKTTHVLNSLEYELEVIANLDCPSSGVVIHPGSFPKRNEGLTAIAKSINKLNFVPGSMLLLENASGQGNALATTFEEIKSIIDQVDEKRREHIGVCIDTCHIFAYGGYDLSLVEEVERLFEDFDRIIGLDRLKLIHLNDSEIPFGKKTDRHACLGQGFIWRDSFDSLVLLMEKCQEYNVPAVLETHGTDMYVLRTLCNISK